jgi:hypothetical protein
MKASQRIFPIVLALGAIGGAIYHVCAETPARSAIIEVAKAAPSPGSTLPPIRGQRGSPQLASKN